MIEDSDTEFNDSGEITVNRNSTNISLQPTTTKQTFLIPHIPSA